MRTVFGLAPILLVSLLASASAHGETALARTFADAWQRQPAAAALGERERAAVARQAAADAWTAAPPSVEIATRSDRLNRRNGARENEIALILPLWRQPGAGRCRGRCGGRAWRVAAPAPGSSTARQLVELAGRPQRGGAGR